MKKPQEKERVTTSDTQEEPEQEPVTPDHEEPLDEQADAPEGEADDLAEVCDGAAAVAEETEDDGDALPAEAYPSLEEYKEKWARGLAQHSKPVPGEFCRENLVPEPIPQLFQDCPWVPFDQLKSDDAMARLSRCRPISGFTPAHHEDSVIRYAHNTGETNFRRRAPMQLAATLGFFLNSRGGSFSGSPQM